MKYYPFHVGDYVSATAHLSYIEDLAYRRMIDRYYMTQRPLPADLGVLCRLIRMPDSMDAVKTVAGEFFVERAGHLHNDRCDEALDSFKQKSRKSAASARARWVKKGANGSGIEQCDSSVTETGHEIISTANASILNENIPCERNANAMRTQCQPITNNKDIKENPLTPLRGKFDPLAIQLPEWLPAELWKLWVTHLRQRRKPMTQITASRQLSALGRWRDKGHDPVAIIDRSLDRGWLGLFEPDVKTNGSHAPLLTGGEL